MRLEGSRPVVPVNREPVSTTMGQLESAGRQHGFICSFGDCDYADIVPRLNGMHRGFVATE